ncbi:MAG: hypothetical protein CMC13_16025 [Flavobacteriaceae bacterium]|nr:hypothetical protein [Flavobacteriaceae bacterium]|tara:strand:+ start:473675 stop:475066 length:1392 start_codon:yes stop_codon:yes gene_type:complete
MIRRSLVYLLLVFCFFSCKEKGLDTKLIASKYYQGVVKILLMDPEGEKIEPGKGYLGRGSGFIVTEDGYLFTNKHVVEMCVKGYVDYNYLEDTEELNSVAVYSEDLLINPALTKVNRTGHSIPIVQVYYGTGENDYKLYIAEVVSIGSGSYDGAMLKIVSDLEGKPVRKKFKTVPLGNSDNVAQGENLCVYGYPAQFGGSAALMLKDLSTISLGIMSGYDYVFNEDYGYLKTDAEIHPGNSGGPVFSEENKVIGIATAKGRTTGIGLVGGVNGMYYISAIDSKAHTSLVEKGLTLPQRSTSINSTKGDKLPIKNTVQANAVVKARMDKELALLKEQMAKYYKPAKLFFALKSYPENNNKLPSLSERYTTLVHGTGAKRGNVWVYIDHSPNQLKTEKLLILVDKLSFTGVYKKYKDHSLTVNSNSSAAYFDFNFYDVGTYRVKIFSEEGVLMATNTLQMKPNRS